MTSASQKRKRDRGAEHQNLYFNSLMQLGYGWHLRLRDGSEENPFDFLSSVGGLLIGQECKRVEGNKISLSVLRSCQIDGLTKFRNTGKNHFSVVVIWFDAPDRGLARGLDEQYIVHFRDWLQWCSDHGTKTTPLEAFRSSLGIRVPRDEKGLWDLRGIWLFKG